ncbi:hypothetical protein A2U01_0089488, partial [Trifolium medium]|nr:hypothetical protein [Trifolium medium]
LANRKDGPSRGDGREETEALLLGTLHRSAHRPANKATPCPSRYDSQMLKWSLELAEFEIHYESRRALKAQ